MNALFTVITAIALSLLWACHQRGIARIVSLYSSIVLTTIVLLLYGGVLFFQWREGYGFLWPWEIPDMLATLDSDAWGILYQTLSITVLISCAIIVYSIFDRYRPQRKALGDARFGNGWDVIRAGCLTPATERILMGKKYGAPLYANGFEHVLVFASSGSGKTRSIAIPNLLSYPHSIVCNDVKLTLFNTTAGYREKVLGHTCYCFAPTNTEGRTHRYNPLAMISDNPLERITDIQRIAHILIPDNQKDPFWPKASRKLFKALTLFLLDSPEHTATLGGMNRLVKQPNFDGWLGKATFFL